MAITCRAEGVKMMDAEIQTHVFAPSGEIPNSPLPLILYRHALSGEQMSPAGCQMLFCGNGWSGNWVNGIFTYWHFHVTGHEVLGCAEGSATVGLGGKDGIEIEFTAGDVAVLPAGVGHIRLSDRRDGFTVVGGYPPRQSGAITRPGDMPLDEAQRRIAGLALPRTDPVTGKEGPLISAWRLR